jgi:hypothetical protein
MPDDQFKSTYVPLTIPDVAVPALFCLTSFNYAAIPSTRSLGRVREDCEQTPASVCSNAPQITRKLMKLVFIAAVAILWVACVWWGGNVSYAQQPSLHEWGQIMGPDPFACRSHDDWSKMIALMGNDAPGATEFGRRHCKKFEATAIVKVENISSDALCVRPMGGYDCFWILPQWVHGLDDN